MSAEPTPSQTIGPFFHDALLDRDRSELVSPDHPEAIRIDGTVYDGEGEPVADAMVEIWQANRAGRYNHLADDRRTCPSTKTSRASGARAQVRAASSPSRRSSPGPFPVLTANFRRRTSWSPSSPVVFWRAW